MRMQATVLLAVLALGGCRSPEASRSRGGGAGGDVGNRPTSGNAAAPGPVLMHEGSDPFWKTPVRHPVTHPELGPARQADALSRDGTR